MSKDNYYDNLQNFYDRIEKLIKVTKLEKIQGYHKILLPDIIDDEGILLSTRVSKNFKFNYKIVDSFRITTKYSSITIIKTKENLEKTIEYYKKLYSVGHLLSYAKYLEHSEVFLHDFNDGFNNSSKFSTNKSIILNDAVINNWKLEEKLSTCAAKKVGCIIIHKNKNNFEIISRGHNHSYNGRKDCNKIFKKENNEWYYRENKFSGWMKDETGSRHKKWSLENEIHAEEEAVRFLSNIKYFNKNNNMALVSYSPCQSCIKRLIESGIKNVIFLKEFDDYTTTRVICNYYGIKLIHIEII